MVVYLAGVALGYGIPYTFLSGFEIVTEEEAEGFIEGGILEEIESANEFSQDAPEEEVTEEVTEETADAQEETAETQE